MEGIREFLLSGGDFMCNVDTIDMFLSEIHISLK